MGHKVIYDADSGFGALISDDPPYALGPVLRADTYDEMTEAFAAFTTNLEGDPQNIPTIKLMQDWHLFVQALYEIGKDQEAELGPADPADDAEPSAAVAVPEPSPPETPAVAPPEVAPGPLDTEPEPDPPEVNPASGEWPEGTPDQGDAEHPTEPCWACGGTGTFDVAGIVAECSACRGKGSLPIPA